MYYIHNTMRDFRTKALRRNSGVKGKTLKFILKDKRTVLCGRPMGLDKDTFLENLEELRELYNAGCIQISFGDEWVDPNDLSSKKGAASAKVTPNFPPDTTANDTVGPLNPPPKVEPIPQDFVMPVSAPDAAIENPTQEMKAYEQEFEQTVASEDNSEDTPKKRRGRKSKQEQG